jgi:hypothetical protein
MLMKTLQCPMTAICLKKKEWDHVMVPVSEAGHKFPWMIAYGPKKVQSLGVKDPYKLQDLTWIQSLMQHGDLEMVTKYLMLTSMEHLYLELVTSMA